MAYAFESEVRIDRHGELFQLRNRNARLMNHNRLLVITSLLSIVLISLHFTDDIVRGLDAAGPQNLGAIAILLVWLVGTLVLGRRLAGYIIMMLGGVFAFGMPVIHMRSSHFPEIVAGPGGFFFFWVLLALGVTGTFSIILAALEIWNSRRAKGISQL
jgi:hypothetical protein